MTILEDEATFSFSLSAYLNMYYMSIAKNVSRSCLASWGTTFKHPKQNSNMKMTNFVPLWLELTTSFLPRWLMDIVTRPFGLRPQSLPPISSTVNQISYSSGCLCFFYGKGYKIDYWVYYFTITMWVYSQRV